MSHTIQYNGHKYKCSKWLKDKIKALEKIENRALEEEYELYLSYKTAVHVPFWNGLLDPDEIEINRKSTRLGILMHKNQMFK